MKAQIDALLPPRIRRIGEGNVFSLSVHLGGGYPSQVPNPFPRLWFQVFLGQCPSLWSHVPSWGVPQSLVPWSFQGVPQSCYRFPAGGLSCTYYEFMLSRYTLTDAGLGLAQKIEQKETQGVLPGMDKDTEGSSRIGFAIGSEYQWNLIWLLSQAIFFSFIFTSGNSYRNVSKGAFVYYTYRSKQKRKY